MSVAPAAAPVPAAGSPPTSGAPPGAPPPTHPFGDALAEEWARTAPAEGQKRESQKGDPETDAEGHARRADPSAAGEAVPAALAEAAAVSGPPPAESRPVESRTPSSLAHGAPVRATPDEAPTPGKADVPPAHSKDAPASVSTDAPAPGLPGGDGRPASTHDAAGTPAAAAPAVEPTVKPTAATDPTAALDALQSEPRSKTPQSKPPAGASAPAPAATAGRPAIKEAQAGADTRAAAQQQRRTGEAAASVSEAGETARAAARAGETSARRMGIQRPVARLSAAPSAASSPQASTPTAHGEPVSSTPTEAVAGTPAQAPPATPGAPAAPGPGVNMNGMIEAIHARIELAARQGESQARISLEPAELGEVRIHLTQTSSGLLARVTADTPAAAQALAAGRGELHEALSSLGTTLLRLDIGSSGLSEENQGRQGEAPAGTSRRSGSTDGEESIETTTGPVRSQPGGPQALGELVDVLA